MKKIWKYKKNVAKKISISQILFTPPWKGIKNEPYSHIYKRNYPLTLSLSITFSDLLASPTTFGMTWEMRNGKRTYDKIIYRIYVYI
mgnify:CR=1 FL=1